MILMEDMQNTFCIKNRKIVSACHFKVILNMHKNKNMEILYGHKPQQLNKLFNIKLEESVVNPLLFVCCLDDLEVFILFLFYVGSVC